MPSRRSFAASFVSRRVRISEVTVGQCSVQGCQLLGQYRFPSGKDGIEGLVLGDGFEGNVRERICKRICCVGVKRLVGLFFFVIVVLGGEQALAGQGDGDAAGVDGDPAPAPLFGDIGCGAAAAGGVKDEIAGFGGLSRLCPFMRRKRACR